MTVTSSSLIEQLKLKCWLKKSIYGDIIEAKEVYIQLSFEGYKRKLVLRVLVKSVSIFGSIKGRTPLKAA